MQIADQVRLGQSSIKPPRQPDTEVMVSVPGYEKTPIKVDQDIKSELLKYSWRIAGIRGAVKQTLSGQIESLQAINPTTKILVKTEGVLKQIAVPITSVVYFGTQVLSDPTIKPLKEGERIIKKNGIWWDCTRENLELVGKGENLTIAASRKKEELQRLRQESEELKALKVAHQELLKRLEEAQSLIKELREECEGWRDARDNDTYFDPQV